jgi:hypothetical protein
VITICYLIKVILLNLDQLLRYGLGAGTHQIRITMADKNDSSLDSVVFIQTGAFPDIISDNSAPEPGILALLVPGLAGMTVAHRRKMV